MTKKPSKFSRALADQVRSAHQSQYGENIFQRSFDSTKEKIQSTEVGVSEVTQPLTINESGNERGNERGNESTNEVTNQVTNERTSERANERTSKVTNQVTNQVTNERTNQVTNKPIKNSSFQTACLTEKQLAVLRYLSQKERPKVLSHALISQATGVNKNSIRTILYRLKNLSFITSNPYGKGLVKGTIISVEERIDAELRNLPGARTNQVTNEVTNEVTNQVTNERGNESGNERGNESGATIYKKERKNSFFLNNAREQWPNANKAGIGPHIIEQARKFFEEKGWNLDSLAEALNRIDWELANEDNEFLTDNHEKLVENIPAWFMSSIKKFGTYRKPKGYLSRAEIIALEKQEEEKELNKILCERKKIREKNNKMLFEEWKNELNDEEIDRILSKSPFGRTNIEKSLEIYWDKEVNKSKIIESIKKFNTTMN
jgi:hypothetical protein